MRTTLSTLLLAAGLVGFGATAQAAPAAIADGIDAPAGIHLVQYGGPGFRRRAIRREIRHERRRAFRRAVRREIRRGM